MRNFGIQRTDEEARRFYETYEPLEGIGDPEIEDPRTISREVMIAIIMGCVGWIIGFGMGMVVS